MTTKRQQQFETFYMDVAYKAATLSRANKRHVGAIVEQGGNILAFGYNGTPHGISNQCEHTEFPQLTLDHVVHAEMNAILKAGDCKGATMYTTYSPCIDCAKHIIQAGIKTVYYHETQQKHSIDSLELLAEAGVTTIHMKDYKND